MKQISTPMKVFVIAILALQTKPNLNIRTFHGNSNDNHTVEISVS